MKLVLTVCAAGAVLGGLDVAHADLRSFTQTYEYSTQPEGTTSVQLWHTQTRVRPHPGAAHLYEGLLEIEHGITEHLDVAFNTMIVQGGSARALTLRRAELEARYRFAQRGELPVDPQLMIELSKDFGDHVFEAEARAIAARDFDELTIAVNAGIQVSGGNDAPETRTQVLWAAGATYQVVPRLRIGVETWGLHEDGTTLADLGPTFSFIASRRFWVAATLGYSISRRVDYSATFEMPTHGSPSVRAIVGFEL